MSCKYDIPAMTLQADMTHDVDLNYQVNMTCHIEICEVITVWHVIMIKYRHNDTYNWWLFCAWCHKIIKINKECYYSS